MNYLFLDSITYIRTSSLLAQKVHLTITEIHPVICKNGKVLLYYVFPSPLVIVAFLKVEIQLFKFVI